MAWPEVAILSGVRCIKCCRSKAKKAQNKHVEKINKSAIDHNFVRSISFYRESVDWDQTSFSSAKMDGFLRVARPNEAAAEIYERKVEKADKTQVQKIPIFESGFCTNVCVGGRERSLLARPTGLNRANSISLSHLLPFVSSHKVLLLLFWQWVVEKTDRYAVMTHFVQFAQKEANRCENWTSFSLLSFQS